MLINICNASGKIYLSNVNGAWPEQFWPKFIMQYANVYNERVRDSVPNSRHKVLVLSSHSSVFIQLLPSSPLRRGRLVTTWIETQQREAKRICRQQCPPVLSSQTVNIETRVSKSPLVLLDLSQRLSKFFLPLNIFSNEIFSKLTRVTSECVCVFYLKKYKTLFFPTSLS